MESFEEFMGNQMLEIPRLFENDPHRIALQQNAALRIGRDQRTPQTRNIVEGNENNEENNGNVCRRPRRIQNKRVLPHRVILPREEVKVPEAAKAKSLEPKASTSSAEPNVVKSVQIPKPIQAKKEVQPPRQIPAKVREEGAEAEEEVAEPKKILKLKPIMDFLKEPRRPNRHGNRPAYYSYIEEDLEEIQKAVAAEQAVWNVCRQYFSVGDVPDEVYCNCGRREDSDFVMTPYDNVTEIKDRRNLGDHQYTKSH